MIRTRRMGSSAEWGVRIAEWPWEVVPHDARCYTPHSAFRNPHYILAFGSGP